MSGRPTQDALFAANSAGFRARLRGEPLTANPHQCTQQEWLSWIDGWRDQDEHLSDRDAALASIGWRR